MSIVRLANYASSFADQDELIDDVAKLSGQGEEPTAGCRLCGERIFRDRVCYDYQLSPTCVQEGEVGVLPSASGFEFAAILFSLAAISMMLC